MVTEDEVEIMNVRMYVPVQDIETSELGGCSVQKVLV